MKDQPIDDGDLAGGTVDLGGLATMTGYAMRRAQIWMFRDLKAKFRPHDISLAQFSILYVVSISPGLAQARIAEALAIERARLVLMLDRLEERMLLERVRSKSDRRSYALHLTESGRALLQTLLGLHLEHEKRIEDMIGKPGKEKLIQLLMPFQSQTFET